MLRHWTIPLRDGGSETCQYGVHLRCPPMLVRRRCRRRW
jgi:hypothetical protein